MRQSGDESGPLFRPSKNNTTKTLNKPLNPASVEPEVARCDLEGSNGDQLSQLRRSASALAVRGPASPGNSGRRHTPGWTAGRTAAMWATTARARRTRSPRLSHRHLRGPVGRQPEEDGGVFKPVEKPLGNARQADLSADLSARQNSAGLILPAPIDGVGFRSCSSCRPSRFAASRNDSMSSG